MSIVVIKWNPAISSYTLGRSDDGFEEAREYRNYEMNWSFWEHEKVHEGDRFFMLRVGEGNTGVVMSGTVTSEPYRGEDWSGKGRVTYYADILPDFMIDSEAGPVLETKALEDAMPDFQWNGGHSGMVLPEKYEEKLEWLWCEFLFKCYYGAYSDALVCNVSGLPSPEIFHFYHRMLPLPMQMPLLQEKGCKCEVCGHSYGRVFKDSLGMFSFYRLFDGDSNEDSIAQNPREHAHCVCSNCFNYYKNLEPAEVLDGGFMPANFSDLLKARI